LFPASVTPAGSIEELKSDENTVPTPETLNATEPSKEEHEAALEATTEPEGAGYTTTLIEVVKDQQDDESFLAAM
jgi:hypothetical protein